MSQKWIAGVDGLWQCIAFYDSLEYTPILQACDYGISKSLKDCQRNAVSNWRREKPYALEPGEKLLAPKRKDMLLWLKTIWESFPTEIVQFSFTGSGYYFEDNVDYSGDTESESEAE